MNAATTDPPVSPDGYQPIGRTAVALSILLAALWSAIPVAISFSVDTLPPIAVAGIRFAIATVFMLFWCRLEGTELRLRRGQVVPSLVMGVLLFAQISLFTIGVRESNSSHGTLFINTFIFWVAAIEHFVIGTVRLPLVRWLGLLIAAAGVVLILSVTPGGDMVPDAASNESSGATGSASAAASDMRNRDEPTMTGDAILLAAACLLGIKIVYTKSATRRVEPGKLIFWHDLFGVILFAACSALFEELAVGQFTLPAVLGLLYQGLVVAGFCFAVQAHLLKRHSASQISVFSFLTPLFGIGISVALRGDPLSPWLLVSGACVAVGIFLVTR